MPTQDRIDTYETPDGTQVPIRDSRVDNLAAGDVSYNNTESGLQATDVQEAIDELAAGAGGSTSADNVSYDNTDSGLAATEVQSALDELTSDMKSTNAESALFHLGFYLDEHGGLCQVNSI